MKKKQVVGALTVATSILLMVGNTVVSADGVTIGSNESVESVETPDKSTDSGVVIGKETTKPVPTEPSAQDGIIGEAKNPDIQPSDVEKPQEDSTVTESSQPIVPSNPKDEPIQPEAKPEEDSKVDESKKEESQQAGNQELPKPTEQPKSVTVTEEEIQAAPIQTNTGHTVVGTSEGRVFVQGTDGTVSLKEAAEIGAVKQTDGTVALKDDKGKLKVLPSTGTTQSVVGTLLGSMFLVVAIFLKKFKFDN